MADISGWRLSCSPFSQPEVWRRHRPVFSDQGNRTELKGLDVRIGVQGSASYFFSHTNYPAMSRNGRPLARPKPNLVHDRAVTITVFTSPLGQQGPPTCFADACLCEREMSNLFLTKINNERD